MIDPFSSLGKLVYITETVQLTKRVCKFTLGFIYRIGSWAQCYKTFYICNLRMFVISKSAFGKVSGLPWSGASFRCTTQVGTGRNCKH